MMRYANIPTLTIEFSQSPVGAHTVDALVPKTLSTGVLYASVVLTAVQTPGKDEYALHDIEKGGPPLVHLALVDVIEQMRRRAGIQAK